MASPAGAAGAAPSAAGAAAGSVAVAVAEASAAGAAGAASGAVAVASAAGVSAVSSVFWQAASDSAATAAPATNRVRIISRFLFSVVPAPDGVPPKSLRESKARPPAHTQAYARTAALRKRNYHAFVITFFTLWRPRAASGGVRPRWGCSTAPLPAPGSWAG